VSFGLTAGLLKDVLPVDARTSAATIRNHLHKVAVRQEAELGDERPRFREGNPADDKELPVPEGPIVVGIDGAYLRNWHDKGKKFEVIVGKSVPEVRDHRYFGLVQTHDDKPDFAYPIDRKSARWKLCLSNWMRFIKPKLNLQSRYQLETTA
jgi:hypothetical protein